MKFIIHLFFFILPLLLIYEIIFFKRNKDFYKKSIIPNLHVYHYFVVIFGLIMYVLLFDDYIENFMELIRFFKNDN